MCECVALSSLGDNFVGNVKSMKFNASCLKTLAVTISAIIDENDIYTKINCTAQESSFC